MLFCDQLSNDACRCIQAVSERWAPVNIYARSLRLIEERKIDVAPIITHQYGIAERGSGALEGGMRLPNYLKEW